MSTRGIFDAIGSNKGKSTTRRVWCGLTSESVLGATIAVGGLVLAMGCSGIAGSISEPVKDGAAQISCAGVGCACNKYYSLGLVQNVDGPGNLEVIGPASAGGLVHYNRDDASEAGKGLAWSDPSPFASGDVNGAGLIQSSYKTGSAHHLEAVFTVGSKLYSAWRNDGGGYAWSTPTLIASGVQGTPGFIQSQEGTVGNFEVVVPGTTGLGHYYRDNDGAQNWVKSGVFGGTRAYDAAVLIQSNMDAATSDGGNLEVLARSGQTLYQFYRNRSGTWSSGSVLATNVAGSPGFIQSTAGTAGNFELITPLASGGMAHYYRDNDAAGTPWLGPTTIPGMSAGAVTAVALIESNSGRLEYVARKDGELYYGWRVGNTWRGPYSFSAQPCSDPGTSGRWEAAVSGGMVGIHAALLKTRNVLFWGFEDHDHHFGESTVFNPSTNEVFTPAWTGAVHPTLFCAGQSATANGEIFVAGGDGTDQGSYHTFSPTCGTSPSCSNGIWNARHSLTGNDLGPEPGSVKRWYPTTAMLQDGNIFVISGSTEGSGVSWSDQPGASTENLDAVNDTWQIYKPGSGIATVTAQNDIVSPFSTASGEFANIGLYPFVYLLPSGKLFVHSRSTTRLLTNANDPALATWSAPIQTKTGVPRTYPRQGSSVLLPLVPDSSGNYGAGKVLLIGGSGSMWPKTTDAATNTVEMLDLGVSPLAWTFRAPMTYPRVLQDAVLLPNGNVFAVGGSAQGHADAGMAPVLTPEIYNPSADTWTRMTPMRVPRGYHSTALLLPDARVLVAGKDGDFQTFPYKYPERRVEIFSPPYLFSSTRPAFTNLADLEFAYRATVTLNVKSAAVASTNIDNVALIRLGATTHGVNMDQRFVGLRITGRPTTSSINVVTPPDAMIAPPGYYMLFLLSNGVPSLAKIVKLG